MGLVLEWIYETIVSTAGKARDAAKRALGELYIGQNVSDTAWMFQLLTTMPCSSLGEEEFYGCGLADILVFCLAAEPGQSLV